MDHRTIPAIALLALSCTDRTGSGDDDPIVGDWLAIEIDGDNFPRLSAYGLKTNWELEVGADHRGRFLYYAEYQEEGVDHRYEYYSQLTVEADAPRYRLSITPDLLDALLLEDSYDGPVTDDSATDDGDTYADEGGEDSEMTGGLAEPARVDALERTTRPRPARAGTLILDCELAAEQLHCTRQAAAAGEDFRDWKFARAPDKE